MLQFIKQSLQYLWNVLKSIGKAKMLNDMNKVDEGVYQGGAITEVPKGIDAIIDLRHEHEDELTATDLQAFHWLPIEDGPFPGIPWLEVAVSTVIAYRKANWSVLIHCSAGVSRSGMVDVAYHMYLNGWTRDKALAYVKTKRPQTAPNPFFMVGLLEFEAHLEAEKIN